MRGFLVALLLGATPALAADFYVDPVSGSDAGDGSAANPWRTLQAVVQANRIETRNWESLPYQPGLNLGTVNAGAPVRAGDTLWLRSGYHGPLVLQGAYNASPITIAAQPGHVPRLKSVLVQAAQNWILRGLSISPSHAPPLAPITIVTVRDHNWFGPAWDVEIDRCEIFTVADASSWGASEWTTVASSGVSVGADRVTVRGSRVRNVRFGISVTGAGARIRGNLIDGFSADGMRGLGDDGLFDYNRVQNNYVGDPPDGNHDDGFQSWSVGPGGVGTGEVRGVTLRGNVFVNHRDPDHPLRSSMQAIGCFDGFFVDWVVENNVVITDHWHGISFLGMRDSRIVNNTVIDLDGSSPGPPWIMVAPHKDGRPSQNVVVRNNLATDFSLVGTNVIADHNLEFANAAALFMAPPYDLRLLPGAAAVDAGSSSLAPAADVDGLPRPQGAGIDLGAYERCLDCIFKDGFASPPGG
jgi:parallel beta helix pectate lyase-like protein